MKTGTRRPLLMTTTFIIILVVVVIETECANNSSLPSHCELWNAALCKPAYQINEWAGGSPDLAVDGNRNQLFYRGSCIHTHTPYSNSWWLVDLIEEYLVHKIVVTNRADDFVWRFESVNVDLFISDPRLDSVFPENTNGVQCVFVATYFGGTKSFDCNTPTYARYIKLYRPIAGDFHFCELEVMVSKKRDGPDCRMTVSKSFNIIRNSIAGNAVTIGDPIEDNILSCLDMCRRKGYLCNGCYWSQNERQCQLVQADPYEFGDLTEKLGTDFYIESETKC